MSNLCDNTMIRAAHDAFLSLTPFVISPEIVFDVSPMNGFPATTQAVHEITSMNVFHPQQFTFTVSNHRKFAADVLVRHTPSRL